MDDEIKCEKCKKILDDVAYNKWYAFDIQDHYKQKFFCSKECLSEWITGKKTGLIISLVIGCALGIILSIDEGVAGILVILLPYMIRQIKETLGSLLKDGAKGEIIALMLLIFGGLTVIYPLYKLIQELREYQRIETVLSESD